MIHWSDWHREPAIIPAWIALGWLYALLTGPWRSRIAPGTPFSPGRAACFYSALAVAYLALGSPLDHAGTVFLFSAHVTQELLLLYPVAALLLLGLPGWLVDGALDRRFLRRPAGLILNPLSCGAAFILGTAAWHLPRLFESALQSAPMQAAHMGTTVAAGLLFWWPLISPSRAFPPAGPAVKALYLTCAQVAFTALFSYVFMADQAIYPTYRYAPRLIAGLSPIEDQRLAGVLLGLVSSLVFLGALGAGFFQWARHSGKATAYR
jgi:putative membrane protein